VDVREAGYSTSFLALLTRLDPNLSAASKTSYCGQVSTSINTFWAPLLTSFDGYGQNQYAINLSFPNSSSEVQPWQLAITATGFRDAYLAAAGSCADAATASKANDLLVQTLNFMYQYGASGDRAVPAKNGGGTGRAGMNYFVGAEASGETPHQPCAGPLAAAGNGIPPCVPGTISGSSGSTSIVGVGTTFQTGGSTLCSGSDYIGILDEVVVHKVVSCQSDTRLTLGTPLTRTINGSYFQDSQPDSSTDCKPSRSTFCFGGTNPDNATDNAGIFGWYYAQTGNPQWRTWGDDLFSIAFGGPAGGPGTNGEPAGPFASGQTTTPFGYITALPPCNLSGPPCGGVTNPGTVPLHWGKDFGIASGFAGAADNYFAYRLMGTSAQCMSP
jgi:hypothetical protein